MLFDQCNSNKRNGQAVINIGATIENQSDRSFIIDSRSSVHFAHMDDIVPGTFRKNTIRFRGVPGSNTYTSIGEGTVQIQCIDEEENVTPWYRQLSVCALLFRCLS